MSFFSISPTALARSSDCVVCAGVRECPLNNDGAKKKAQQAQSSPVMTGRVGRERAPRAEFNVGSQRLERHPFARTCKRHLAGWKECRTASKRQTPWQWRRNDTAVRWENAGS